jgi:hypothetical protein
VEGDRAEIAVGEARVQLELGMAVEVGREKQFRGES